MLSRRRGHRSSTCRSVEPGADRLPSMSSDRGRQSRPDGSSEGKVCNQGHTREVFGTGDKYRLVIFSADERFYNGYKQNEQSRATDERQIVLKSAGARPAPTAVGARPATATTPSGG